MSFDDEVDELKRELQAPKLALAERKDATAKLCEKLKTGLNSRRLQFVIGNENGEPSIAVSHTSTREQLASVSVNEDGSITFQSSLDDDDDEEENGYFPPAAEYFNEAEFLEDAPEVFKLGLAEYELDREEEEKTR